MLPVDGSPCPALLDWYLSRRVPAESLTGSEVAAIADAELLHRAVQVGLDRADREHEAIGDLGVAESLAREADELALARGQHRGDAVEAVDYGGSVPCPGSCRSRARAAARRAESWRPSATKRVAACCAACMA